MQNYIVDSLIDISLITKLTNKTRNNEVDNSITVSKLEHNTSTMQSNTIQGFNSNVNMPVTEYWDCLKTNVDISKTTIGESKITTYKKKRKDNKNNITKECKKSSSHPSKIYGNGPTKQWARR